MIHSVAGKNPLDVLGPLDADFYPDRNAGTESGRRPIKRVAYKPIVTNAEIKLPRGSDGTGTRDALIFLRAFQQREMVAPYKLGTGSECSSLQKFRYPNIWGPL